jgi:hypothetical protein
VRTHLRRSQCGGEPPRSLFVWLLQERFGLPADNGNEKRGEVRVPVTDVSRACALSVRRAQHAPGTSHPYSTKPWLARVAHARCSVKDPHGGALGRSIRRCPQRRARPVSSKHPRG